MGLSDRTIALGAVGLRKSYGSVQANRNITLSAHAGAIHAVVGENGAGKSTLMHMLQGVQMPDDGHIIVDGKRTQFTGPGDALERGIGMVHQEFMMAPDLTLLENLVLGEEPVRRNLGPISWIDWHKAEADGQVLAQQIGARIDWHRRASSVPVHVLQFVEIIRLLRRGCNVLILDEPTSVLAPPQVDELFDLLRKLREGGATILFISHKIGEVMALADKVTVMRQGETVFHAAIPDTTADEISSHIVQDVPTKTLPELHTTAFGNTVLKVDSIASPGIQQSQPLNGISFELRAGEILGLAGVSGNGQVELVECIAGLRDISEGILTLMDTDISKSSALERRMQGLAYVSADRRHEGLTTEASIETNVIAGSHREAPVAKGGVLNHSAMRRVATERLSALAVTYGRLDDSASSLSGGNQQKLVFAREIAGRPKLLIASQPTRGVDLNGIAAIHRLIRDFRDGGGTVLLASEELDELVSLSDRVVVLSGGTLVGELDNPAGRRSEIGRMMVQGADT